MSFKLIKYREICERIVNGEDIDRIAEHYRMSRNAIMEYNRLNLAVRGMLHVSASTAARLLMVDHKLIRAASGGQFWRDLAGLQKWANQHGWSIKVDVVRAYAAGFPVPYLDTPAAAPEPVTAATAEPVSMTRADLLADISNCLADLSALVHALAEVTHD
jgi:hypothetical protein